jgi:hypothetical protein
MSSEAPGTWYLTVPRVDLKRYVLLLNEVSALRDLTTGLENRMVALERALRAVADETLANATVSRETEPERWSDGHAFEDQ